MPVYIQLESPASLIHVAETRLQPSRLSLPLLLLCLFQYTCVPVVPHSVMQYCPPTMLCMLNALPDGCVCSMPSPIVVYAQKMHVQNPAGHVYACTSANANAHRQSDIGACVDPFPCPLIDMSAGYRRLLSNSCLTSLLFLCLHKPTCQVDLNGQHKTGEHTMQPPPPERPRLHRPQPGSPERKSLYPPQLDTAMVWSLAFDAALLTFSHSVAQPLDCSIFTLFIAVWG